MYPRVLKVIPKKEYILELFFDNGEHKFFSILPYIQYPVFLALQKEEFFKGAYVQNGTVCWGDTEVIDLDPDTLYIDSVSTLAAI